MQSAMPSVQQPAQHGPLFHYTTAQGLIGIVENESLFATHFEFSNDSSECKLILPIIAKAIEPEFRAIVASLMDREIMSRDFHIEHGTNVYPSESLKAANTLLSATNNLAPFYTTSFCIHSPGEDSYRDGPLSQWRGYARGGFAIEFDESKIKELIEWEMKNFFYQHIAGDVVRYQDHESFVGDETFKGLAGAFMHPGIRETHGDQNDILGTREVSEFVMPFLAKAPLLKSEGFKEEREYRIVATCFRQSTILPSDEGKRIKPIEFRSRGSSNVIPYIRLFGEAPLDFPIKAIIVGPHPQQHQQRMAVELLLEENGIDADVRVSSIPFRD